MGCCGKNSDDGRSDNVEMRDAKDGKNRGGKWGAPKPFDPTFDGPIKNRSCTDIICCILFVLYVLGMVVLGIIAFVKGNPYKLLNSVDSDGNICGFDEIVRDRPKLVFFDLTECVSVVTKFSTSLFGASCPTKQRCAKKCPDQNALGTDVRLNVSDLVCDYDLYATFDNRAPSKETLIDLIRLKRCAPYYLKSSDVLNRCIPTIVDDAITAGLKTASQGNVTASGVQEGSLAVQALLNLQNLGQKVIADVQQSWYWILAALGIAMVGSFLYIIVMRWIAGLLVWLSIYAILTALGFSVYYSWTKYQELSSNNDDESKVFLTVSFGLDSLANNRDTWYWLTIILGIILGILVLILLALYKRISIAIQIIKEGSRAVSAVPFSLFFPVIPWLLQIILFAWFVAVLAFLVTAGDPRFQVVSNDNSSGNPCTPELREQLNSISSEVTNKTCNFVDFTSNEILLGLQIVHLFGWFWVMNFIIALGMCVLAGAFASYYWALDKKNDIPKFAVTSSFFRTLRYHTGSLAFGSLIIAIVQLIRAGLEYLDHKLNGPGQQSEIVKYLVKCLKCCFWCLEKFLKFLNKNAYIMIAVHGKNFCVSAKDAFFLLMRNVLRVVVLDKVTDFILFLGQLTITAALGIGSFYWFEREKNLNYYLAPVIIITVGAYVVAHAFFSVYNMAIDTIFLCFLEDSERNDGTQEKPYYMSKSLRKILGKKNKKPESDSE
ncbi:choline transporter-like protein 4 [Montipora capricornis]|uniref:choline transporter-like protein 4 n=1 Tax=Montipora capricornis TaxID=246305 RepID=UPI0035F1AAED